MSLECRSALTVAKAQSIKLLKIDWKLSGRKHFQWKAARRESIQYTTKYERIDFGCQVVHVVDHWFYPVTNSVTPRCLGIDPKTLDSRRRLSQPPSRRWWFYGRQLRLSCRTKCKECRRSRRSQPARDEQREPNEFASLDFSPGSGWYGKICLVEFAVSAPWTKKHRVILSNNKSWFYFLNRPIG